MKNLLLNFVFILAFISLANAQENKQQTRTEQSERKIIIKKMTTNGDEKMDEIAIQKMVDSILLAQGIHEKGNKKIKIIINKKDGETNSQIDVDVDDVDEIERELELREQGNHPKRYHMIEERELNQEQPENKAVLGLMLDEVGGDNGALITEIMEGSGASQSKLNVGDIILKIDGKKMNSYSDIIEYLSDKKVGDKVKIKYLHDGDIESTSVKLGKRTTNASCTKNISCCQAKNKCNSKNFIQNGNINGSETIIKEIELNHLNDINKMESIQSSNPNEIIVNEIVDHGSQSSLDIEYLSSTPNPNQGQMKVKFEGNKGPTTIRLVDMNGKELFEEKLDQFDGVYNKDITVTDAKGTLILYITQGKKIITEKIIVK